jgi:hypothetical protein
MNLTLIPYRFAARKVGYRKSVTLFKLTVIYFTYFLKALSTGVLAK